MHVNGEATYAKYPTATHESHKLFVYPVAHVVHDELTEQTLQLGMGVEQGVQVNGPEVEGK